VSPVRRQRKILEANILYGELRKIKPPTFNGEHKKGEYSEAWLLEMKKYFQVHDYPSQVEARITTYRLQGKETMWWDQLKQDKNLDEKKISWRQFKGYFQVKYLSEHYYETKMKEFFELKLGTMTMEEYEKWFFELLKYVDFIKDEKVKIQRFMSGLPSEIFVRTLL
jgi:predicted AlkP superfamily phosphohydrolase/phosphomutase